MTPPRVSVEQLEAVIRPMPAAFAILDFVAAFQGQSLDRRLSSPT
jgi:hypothetical protein